MGFLINMQQCWGAGCPPEALVPTEEAAGLGVLHGGLPSEATPLPLLMPPSQALGSGVLSSPCPDHMVSSPGCLTGSSSCEGD